MTETGARPTRAVPTDQSTRRHHINQANPTGSDPPDGSSHPHTAAPMAATFYGMNAAQPIGPYLIIGFAVWVVIGVGLHLIARLSLRRLLP
jgi:hypothetical protein